jgi:hypothetical protein
VTGPKHAQNATLKGCTISTKANYNPAAYYDTSPSSCVDRAYGCPANAIATNANSTANYYNHSAASSQCHGSYCAHNGTLQGIVMSAKPTRVSVNALWQCPTGLAVLAFGTTTAAGVTHLLPAYDECSTLPCSSSTMYSCGQISPTGRYFEWQCHDPNQYWLGDFTCSCAYNDLTDRYPASIMDSCGNETVFEADGRIVSEFEMSRYLSRDSTRRNHLCRVTTGRSDCL